MSVQVLRLRPGTAFPAHVDTIVVIDVLRMTSTAATLLADPARTHLAVAATLDDLPRLGLSADDCVVVSELVSAAWPGAWVDNSPDQVRTFPFGARTPVLVTTNGTRALLAASACASRVVLASFVDLRAVVRHLRAAAPASVGILPAGHFASGEARLEDDLCADVLALSLAGGEPDLDAPAESIRADARVRRRAETHPGYATDVSLALRPRPDAGVAVFEAVDVGVGRVVRLGNGSA